MKASETIVGQWYRVSDSGGSSDSNFYRCPVSGPDEFTFMISNKGLSSSVRFIDAYEADFTHLPNCTGYDWKPPAPEPVYRPFANAAEFQPFRDRWIIEKGRANSIRRIYAYTDRGVNDSTYPQASRLYTFEDGTPFGILDSKDAAS